MDRATEQIRTQIQVVERNLKVLEETIVKMIRLREDTQQFMQEFATSMNNIGAEEYDTNVAHCIQSLGTSFSNVSKKTTDLMLHRPQSHILQVLTHIQDWGIVPIQRLLDDRERIERIELRLQREFERAYGERDREKKKRLLSDQKRRKENVNQLVAFHLEQFEGFRITQTKKILQEITRSEAYFYAKSLEELATPCALIAQVHTDRRTFPHP
ncbi:unnamed protein product [Albugo candida]|uniref:Sorting nexin/Vps5-like C-terminal domain-containing protein n=1 Tax=Albugo candida TaxID=65357 RepID=A0A024GFL4_9STRA|nr:unnamed protein product [Albugo candida]|eukprot:CCI45472.1 unnamed protein product [Albugo candida]